MHIIVRALRFLILNLIVLMLIAACTVPEPLPTASKTSPSSRATSLPTKEIAVLAPTDTPTPTSTPTPKPTQTSTPTVTSTPTLTPTRIRATNVPRPTQSVTVPSVVPGAKIMQPGIYPQNRCITIAMPGVSGSAYNLTPNDRSGDQPAIMCVTDIEVLGDGALKVNVSWSLDSVRREWRSVVMNQNGEFRNAYLLDNRGNRYTARELSGAARDPADLPANRPRASGWYVFPSPGPGATSFTLRDDAQHVNIENLVIP